MKLAVKLLSPTDLTLFEPIFRTRTVSGQKGINLNSEAIHSIYPNLPAYAPDKDGLPITLDIYGPGGAPLHRMPNKFTKSPPKPGTRGAKNWRLSGGVVIPEPADEPGRYSQLSEDDVAVFGFSGLGQPDAVEMVLFAKGAGDADTRIINRLTSALLLKKRVRSMVEIGPSQLDDLTSDLPARHPVRLLLSDGNREEEILEAAAGDEAASERLYNRARAKRTRPASWDELAAADRRNREIGRRGEQIIDHLLSKEQAAGKLSSYAWEADDNAVSPFDFSLVQAGGHIALVDVKTTSSGFDARFFLSAFEAERAACGPAPYYIYRVFDLEAATGPKLRRSLDISSKAQALLASLSDLPTGFGIASLTIDTDALDWESPEPLELPPELLSPEG